MEEIYQENAKLVYRFLLKYCHDSQLAEELTQETFLRAMNSIERYDYSCKISVWLCQIAKHIYLQYLEKRGKEIPSEEITLDEAGSNTGEKGIEEQVVRRYELLDVLKDMQNLPEQMREVIYLRTMAELSFKEIGEILGKSENWARVTFYRGKERLLKGRE
ncbi:MAG: sigma-70 family RNA polymerase sigma factor [Eubacterium sp.]|nr:sigma-70 family RNA polymerase sigma factor [Eubacterium sp.]MCM1216278.1 sigma-70 family RNA polymerase sigma factor [Lachnospiraceae bacterium]MCM1303789.1 sigma-70 family RNA polymerase sigma factor [Butyrivibrio sp.]MCM1342831.1 sigma-70 family RNA polymerase sigma factor [Muribaculaceae bacterium]MCM1240045.1 sigma-70 family RNA polymerase sigma factor [Lachnospiraceae bacterium]